MSEARPRSTLAQISPNRVAQSARPNHASRLPAGSPSARRILMEELDEIDDTRNSLPKSNDSNVSNLSLLSDGSQSDDLGRRILEHARWSKRNALEGGPVKMQAFGKARPSAGLAHLMGGFQEKEHGLIVDLDTSPAPRSERSASPNIPRQWGRKGIQKNGFLRRLTATDEIGDLRGRDQNSLDAAEIPLPSTGENLPPQGRAPLLDSPSNDVPAKSNTSKQEEEHLPTRLFAPKRRIREDIYRQTNVPKLVDLTYKKPDPESQIPPRQSSRDLLRQLARAASSTPSPTPTHDDEYHTSSLQTMDVAEERGYERRSPSFIPTLRRTQNQRRSKSHVFPSNQGLPTPLDDTNPQANAPGTTDTWVNRLAEPRQLNAQRGNSIKGINSLISGSTSQATGNRQSRRRLPARSALEAILCSSKDDLSNDPLGDTTIASLKDMVAQDETGELTAILQLDEDTLNLVSNVTVPVNQEQGLRSEEKEALRRMGEALKSARMGLRDASRGIKRVEHQFEEVENKRKRSSPRAVCNYCGCLEIATLTGILFGAWAYFRSFYYSWPKYGRLRLTWLGLFTLVLMSWVTAEVTLCEIYCHPIYARSMVGYGVDINAPRLGFVAPTILIKRPFNWLLRPLWKFSRWIMVSIFHSLFSTSTNGADTNTKVGGAVGGTLSRSMGFSSGPEPPFGHVVGFGQDEIL